MNINWLTLEQRIPVPKKGWENAPYISCVVFSCNPEAHSGGVIETCRWDVANNCWFKNDIHGNWFLQKPYEITHYIDKIDFPNLLRENNQKEDYGIQSTGSSPIEGQAHKITNFGFGL